MRRTVYDMSGLPRQTPNTITDIDTLEAQLDQFREQGYSIDLGENEVGVNGIAAAIVDGMGDVAAAISVCGPSNRLTEEGLELIAKDVIAAAGAIAVSIGVGDKIDERDSQER